MPRGRAKADGHHCRQCQLCGDLPQAHLHFEAWYWKDIQAGAEQQIAEAQAAAEEAAAHLRMLERR